MNLQQMIDAIGRRVDDVLDTPDATAWLNDGKNQMAIAIGASFPDVNESDLTSTFVFDSKYHEAPVLYAAACFKEQDTTLGEVANFMTKFENLKKEFVKNYELPARYRDDRLSQQFTATAVQTTFTITKEGYDPAYGDLKVYVNDALYTDTITPLTTLNYTFTISARSAGDAVTAVWEEHTDLLQPPYNWYSW